MEFLQCCSRGGYVHFDNQVKLKLIFLEDALKLVLCSPGDDQYTSDPSKKFFVPSILALLVPDDSRLIIDAGDRIVPRLSFSNT